jgi:ectoine hydroxylase-related dioxygenase (phytanoyl-CoA dioxygenase family)
MPETTDRPQTAPGAGLSAAQKAQFERDGFLVLRGLFSPAEVAQIRDTFMQQAKDGPVAGLSAGRHDDRPLDPSDPLDFYPRMMNPHARPDLPVGPLARRFLLDGRLYPVLRDLLDEEPAAAQSMFYFKPPKARGQELHQDNFYLRVRPGTCMAAWLAVDDVDSENGGMKVVPGSHRLPVACPQQADPAVSFTTDYVPVPEGMAAVHADMRAGDVLFFNGSLIHGSTPNTSATRFRRSLIFHYVPEGSLEMSEWYQALRFDGRPVAIPAATGGGPCGTEQAVAGPH